MNYKNWFDGSKKMARRDIVGMNSLMIRYIFITRWHRWLIYVVLNELINIV